MNRISIYSKRFLNVVLLTIVGFTGLHIFYAARGLILDGQIDWDLLYLKGAVVVLISYVVLVALNYIVFGKVTLWHSRLGESDF